MLKQLATTPEMAREVQRGCLYARHDNRIRENSLLTILHAPLCRLL